MVEGHVYLQPTENDEAWDAERLRREIALALERESLTLEDLLETWDNEVREPYNILSA